MPEDMKSELQSRVDTHNSEMRQAEERKSSLLTDLGEVVYASFLGKSPSRQQSVICKELLVIDAEIDGLRSEVVALLVELEALDSGEIATGLQNETPAQPLVDSIRITRFFSAGEQQKPATDSDEVIPSQSGTKGVDTKQCPKCGAVMGEKSTAFCAVCGWLRP